MRSTMPNDQVHLWESISERASLNFERTYSSYYVSVMPLMVKILWSRLGLDRWKFWNLFGETN